MSFQTVSFRSRLSPDGASIAFESNKDGNTEIYIMNADGSEVRCLTYTFSQELFPIWWP